MPGIRRFHRLSVLARDRDGADRLRAAASQFELLHRQNAAVAGAAVQHWLRARIVVAEIDAIPARLREARDARRSVL